MGVPVMELFLITSADKTRRAYTKGILDARRTRKDWGKPEGTITPIRVTLTKDGVLKALNDVPFKNRGQLASKLLPVSKEQWSGFVDVVPVPDDWRKLPIPKATEADYPTDGLFDPGYFPEDRKRLTGQHPLYIAGWNRTKAKTRGHKVRAT